MKSIEPDLVERAVTGLHESLLKHLPDTVRTDSRILDVGCGTGAWLDRLYNAGYTNLFGIDGDTEQTRIKPATISKVNLNEQRWKGVEGSFHLITAIEVIEHLDNIGNFLENVHEVLDEAGYFLLTTPNIESIASRLRFLLLGELKQFDRIGDQTHIVPVTTTTLGRIAPRHGLRVIAIWGYPNDGSTITSRPWVRTLCSILRTVLPEKVPGDNLCVLLQRS